MASQIKTPRIIHPQDKSYYWLGLLILVMLAAVAWQAYQWGEERAKQELSLITAKLNAVQQQLERLQTSYQQSEAERIRYQREIEVERQASRALQQEMAQIEQAKAELQKEKDMLLELIAENKTSLYIRNFKLRPTDKKNHFIYQFTLVQVLEQFERTQGKLVLKLSGKKKGKKMTLSGSSFLASGKKSQNLSFSHYQDIQGEIILPKGFVPSRLQIEFLPNHKKMNKLLKSFAWRVED